MSTTHPSVPWHRQTAAFAERHLRGLRRSKLVLVLAVAWPLAWYFLTVVAFLPDDLSGYELALSKGATAISYALFGAFTVAVATFAAGFARDDDRGLYRLFRSLPIVPSADLAGRFLAGLAVATLSYGVTIVVAYAHGARFEPRPTAIVVVPLTLVAFCLVALLLSLALGILVSEPEYVSTIAVVLVLVAYYVTGFNGIQPGMIAQDATFVNWVPNSLATRMQIYHLFDGDLSNSGMIPPEMPSGWGYVAATVASAVVAATASLGLLRVVGYRRD